MERVQIWCGNEWLEANGRRPRESHTVSADIMGSQIQRHIFRLHFYPLRTGSKASPPQLLEDTLNINDSCQPPLNPVMAYKRKTKSCEDSLFCILREKKSEDIDEDKTFLLSLVPSFKRMRNDEKYQAKMEFLSFLLYFKEITLSISCKTLEINIVRQWFHKLTSEMKPRHRIAVPLLPAKEHKMIQKLIETADAHLAWRGGGSQRIEATSGVWKRAEILEGGSDGAPSGVDAIATASCPLPTLFSPDTLNS
ncbi:hypothetical protein J437_LFUL006849 [Ladona fulva]|uniref:BESS domain-containing protein n=1 Tax=Ladona fulva TaxID=123851 RepID=A0A8K0P8X6_LADFU|nr:hypothetical protein J437_LFUL006849 [Ladona fulva]